MASHFNWSANVLLGMKQTVAMRFDLKTGARALESRSPRQPTAEDRL